MKINKHQIWIGLAVCSILIMLIGCTSEGNESSASDEDEASSDKITVVTTLAQIGEPLSVIGEDRLKVISLMGPGVDPHLYKATQSDLNKLQEADLIFYNGLELEANMIDMFEGLKASKPVVALGDAIDQDELLFDGGAADPHIWFNLDLWQKGLDHAVSELKKYDPQYADQYEANKQAYFDELNQLKEWAQETMQQIPASQRVLVTAHDAFGYFGEMFDMEVVGLQGLSTEDEVGVSDIQAIVDLIVSKNIPAVFVESSVNPDAINAVIEGARQAGVEVRLGGELFSDAMGEAGTPEGTYLGMYRHNVETIYTALMGEEAKH